MTALRRLAFLLVGLILALPLWGQQQSIPVSTHTITALSGQVASASLPEGLRSALLAQLAAAQRAYAAGLTDAAIENVQDFADEIRSQTLPLISAATRQRWLAEADGVRQALAGGLSLGGAEIGARGGVLRLADAASPLAGAELRIPVGALAQTTFISVSIPESTPQNAVLDFPGGGLRFEPAGLRLGASATLVLPYPDADGDGVVDGREFTVETLKVGAADELGRIAFPARTLDRENRTHLVRVGHLGEYWNVTWRWSSTDVLTYKFSWPTGGVSIRAGENLAALQEGVRRAVAVWASALAEAGFTLRETPDSAVAAFRFAFFSTNTPLTVYESVERLGGAGVAPGLLPELSGPVGDGAVQVYALENPGAAGAFFNIAFNSDFGFDSADRLAWTTDNRGDSSAISIEAVAIHGIGHALGLNDVPFEDVPQPAVMSTGADLLNPEVCLAPGDVEAFRQLYGVADSAVLPACPNAALAVDPNPHDFGTLAGGTSAEAVFTVRNAGSGTLVLGDVAGGGDVTVDLSRTERYLRPGQATRFTATITPSGSGPREEAVRIFSNAPDSPARVALSADLPYAPPACTISASPSEIGAEGSAVLTWRLENSPTEGVLDGGVGAVELAAGSATVTPGGTTHYVLSVSNPAGAATCSTTVSVISFPSSDVIWTRRLGAEGDDVVYGAAADSGGVYVVGEETAALDALGAGFVRRYDVGGEEQWSRRIDSSRVEGVVVDASGVYVVGVTEAALAEDAGFGSWDGFLRKYDPAGNELWTRQWGTPGRDRLTSVAVDASGQIYAAGSTEGAWPDQVSGGSWDALLLKLDAAGAPVWTRQFGSAGDDFARDVAVDPFGGVLVVGDVSGALGGQTGAGMADAFVRRYTPDGAEAWTRQFGGPSFDFAEGVTVDPSGVYVAGGVDGALSGQVGSGAFDGFLRKYDFEGGEAWTRQFGGALTESATGVASDGAGVFVTGSVEGAFAGHAGAGAFDAFVMVYDGAGNVVWSRQYGTSESDDGRAVALQPAVLYLVGGTLGAFDAAGNAGASDGFILKISR